MYSVNLKKTEQDYFARLATKAESESTLRDLSAFGGFCGSLVIKFDKAQRHQYSTFDVGRWMFDVKSFHCAGQVEFHPSGAADLKSLPALGGRPVKSK